MRYASCQRDEPYDAVVASLLPAALRKRRDGVIPAKGGADAGARCARAPGAADALARRRVPTRLPGPTAIVARVAPLDSRRSARAHRRDVSEHGRPPGNRVGSRLRASGSATPLVRRAGASASPARRWQARMDAGRGPWAAEGPAASEASPDVSTSLRRRRGMTSSRRFRSGAGSERSERPRPSGDVVLHCRVGLSSRLVCGSAPRSGQ